MNERLKVVEWLENKLKELAIVTNFGEKYVEIKMDFYRECHAPHIFSTRLSLEEIHFHILNKIPVKPVKDLPLGEYDKIFNDWMKSLK